MKRAISFFIIVALLFSCTACAGSTLPAAGAAGHQERPLRGEEPQVPVRQAEASEEKGGQDMSRIPEGSSRESGGGGTETSGDPEGVQEPEDTQEREDSREEEDTREPEQPAVRTVDPAKPMVALTFDDGPHKTYTDQILDILEENHAVATFFEVGRNVANCPGPLSRMVDLGCEIGSHSNAHKDLSKLKASALKEDLDKADQAFLNAVGFVPTLLRPPYGAVNKTVKYGTGRTVLTWTVDTEDWLSQDTDKVVSYVQSLASLDGEIVLLHSTYESTVAAVRILVPWLLEKGYQLVTVSELMAYYYGEVLEPGEFFGYTYFTTHGRTDTPAVLPDQSAGESGAEGAAPDSAPSGGEGQPPAGDAQPPAGQAEQPGKSGQGSAVPGSSPSAGDTVILDGSAAPDTVRPEKPVIPGAPSGEGEKPVIPSAGGGNAGEENSGGAADQPSSL